MIGSKPKPPQTVNPMQIEAPGFRAYYILKMAGDPCADETTTTKYGVDKNLIDQAVSALTKDNYNFVFKVYATINNTDRPIVGDSFLSKINIFNKVFGITHPVVGFGSNFTSYLMVMPDTYEIVPLPIINGGLYPVNCPIIPRFEIKFALGQNSFTDVGLFETWFYEKLTSGGVGQSISNFRSFGDKVTFNLANSDAFIDGAFDYNAYDTISYFNEINITEILDYEGKITSLGDTAFINLENLTTVVLPAVTTHGTGLFNGCISLQKIIMPLADEFLDTNFDNINGNNVQAQFSAAALASESKTLSMFFLANNVTLL